MVSKQALIIEDDINSARVLAHLLSKVSIESIIVTDIAQIEAQIDAEPDVVFIDLEMPQMNGYEVLSELLTISHYTSIPIVASSVHTNEINAVQEAGFHSFIGTPLAKERFSEHLARILAGERVWEV
jgi:CheY-like chemotaxis protein